MIHNWQTAQSVCNAVVVEGKNRVFNFIQAYVAGLNIGFSFIFKLYEKKYKISIKLLAKPELIVYTMSCCGMIAVKREVAAYGQVFRGANVKLGNWRQVTVSRIYVYVIE